LQALATNRWSVEKVHLEGKVQKRMMGAPVQRKSAIAGGRRSVRAPPTTTKDIGRGKGTREKKRAWLNLGEGEEGMVIL